MACETSTSAIDLTALHDSGNENRLTDEPPILGHDSVAYTSSTMTQGQPATCTPQQAHDTTPVTAAALQPSSAAGLTAKSAAQDGVPLHAAANAAYPGAVGMSRPIDTPSLETIPAPEEEQSLRTIAAPANDIMEPLKPWTSRILPEFKFADFISLKKDMAQSFPGYGNSASASHHVQLRDALGRTFVVTFTSYASCWRLGAGWSDVTAANCVKPGDRFYARPRAQITDPTGAVVHQYDIKFERWAGLQGSALSASQAMRRKKRSAETLEWPSLKAHKQSQAAEPTTSAAGPPHATHMPPGQLDLSSPMAADAELPHSDVANAESAQSAGINPPTYKEVTPQSQPEASAELGPGVVPVSLQALAKPLSKSTEDRDCAVQQELGEAVDVHVLVTRVHELLQAVDVNMTPDKAVRWMLEKLGTNSKHSNTAKGDQVGVPPASPPASSACTAPDTADEQSLHADAMSNLHSDATEDEYMQLDTPKASTGMSQHGAPTSQAKPPSLQGAPGTSCHASQLTDQKEQADKEAQKLPPTPSPSAPPLLQAAVGASNMSPAPPAGTPGLPTRKAGKRKHDMNQTSRRHQKMAHIVSGLLSGLGAAHQCDETVETCCTRGMPSEDLLPGSTAQAAAALTLSKGPCTPATAPQQPHSPERSMPDTARAQACEPRLSMPPAADQPAASASHGVADAALVSNDRLTHSLPDTASMVIPSPSSSVPHAMQHPIPSTTMPEAAVAQSLTISPPKAAAKHVSSSNDNTVVLAVVPAAPNSVQTHAAKIHPVVSPDLGHLRDTGGLVGVAHEGVHVSQLPVSSSQYATAACLSADALTPNALRPNATESGSPEGQNSDISPRTRASPALSPQLLPASLPIAQANVALGAVQQTLAASKPAAEALSAVHMTHQSMAEASTEVAQIKHMLRSCGTLQQLAEDGQAIALRSIASAASTELACELQGNLEDACEASAGYEQLASDLSRLLGGAEARQARGWSAIADANTPNTVLCSAPTVTSTTDATQPTSMVHVGDLGHVCREPHSFADAAAGALSAASTELAHIKGTMAHLDRMLQAATARQRRTVDAVAAAVGAGVTAAETVPLTAALGAASEEVVTVPLMASTMQQLLQQAERRRARAFDAMPRATCPTACAIVPPNMPVTRGDACPMTAAADAHGCRSTHAVADDAAAAAAAAAAAGGDGHGGGAVRDRSEALDMLEPPHAAAGLCMNANPAAQTGGVTANSPPWPQHQNVTPSRGASGGAAAAPEAVPEGEGHHHSPALPAKPSCQAHAERLVRDICGTVTKARVDGAEAEDEPVAPCTPHAARDIHGITKECIEIYDATLLDVAKKCRRAAKRLRPCTATHEERQKVVRKIDRIVAAGGGIVGANVLFDSCFEEQWPDVRYVSVSLWRGVSLTHDPDHPALRHAAGISPSLGAVLRGELPFRLMVSHCGGKDWGVYAAEDIPAGKFVTAYVGEILDAGEIDERESRRAADRAIASDACQGEPGEFGGAHSYVMGPILNAWAPEVICNAAQRECCRNATEHSKPARAKRGQHIDRPGWLSFPGCNIDATHVGNVSRWFNHSCNPTLRCIEVDVPHGVTQILSYTLHTIQAGEEVTVDYHAGMSRKVLRGLDNIKRCLCGQRQCKGLTA